MVPEQEEEQQEEEQEELRILGVGFYRSKGGLDALVCCVGNTNIIEISYQYLANILEVKVDSVLCG